MQLTWKVLIFLLTLNIGSYLLFLKGFFPSKKILPGFNNQLINGDDTPQFDKVVFMVIDALRADFLFSEESEFKFVHQLINDNHAVPFTGYSNPPTVTLPRLKGITLGTTPNFLDAILNIADDKDNSQGLLGNDNWLHQFKFKSQESPKLLNFYGDDTWLKLFPDFFIKTDGTNSFFVNDFYEVDNNVTRHLEDELQEASTWDGLFLHYLGLDHIGHKTGPNSSYMKSKQQEMDGIIKRIYGFLEGSTKHKNTLFVVMGDHGMNEIGNHGGSSSGETHAGLLFISSKFSQLGLSLKAPLPVNYNYEYYDQINQIDLIPTLSLLLNLPIPKNNLGVIIKQFLTLFEPEKYHQIVWQNCQQFLQLFKLNNPSNSKFDQWFSTLSTIDDDYEFLSEVQDYLIETSSSYDYSSIYPAIILSLLCAVGIIGYFNYYYYYYVANYEFSKYSEILGFQICMVIYSFHFHGSSLIEEEHHIWWILSLSFMLYFMFSLKFKNFQQFFVVLTCLRVIKGWCNTGQKFKTYYTLSNFLVDNSTIMWMLIFITYLTTGCLLYFQGSLRHDFNFLINSKSYDKSYFHNDFNNVYAFMSVSMLVSVSFTFKLLQGYLDGYNIPGWLKGYVDWNFETFNIIDPGSKSSISTLLLNLSNYALKGTLALMIIRTSFRYTRQFRLGFLTDLVNMLNLFLINQTKIELIPMFLVFQIMKFNLSKILVSQGTYFKRIDKLVLLMSTFSLLMSHLTFFSMGGTNLLATVDLSNSYNGVGSYELEKVSVLTFVSNFNGAIFWSLSCLQLLFETNIVSFNISNYSNDIIFMPKLKFRMLILRLTYSLAFYSICGLNLILSCFNLRYHLFIWTVFSPKLLYFGVWFILVNVLIDFIVSGLLLTIS